MRNKELIINDTPPGLDGKSTRPESDVSQLEVWQRPCENLNEETDRSMSLIDSTAKDLHGLMRGMFANQPEPEIRTPDIDKVQTAVGIGRAINELMKTKLDAIKLYREITATEEGEEDEEGVNA